MKTNALLLLLALVLPASLQANYPYAGSGLGAPPTPPSPPPGMSDPSMAYGYGGMSPTLNAPTAGSPYAGPTMANPNPYGYNGYGSQYQQPAQTNSWNNTVQQGMGGSGPSLLNYKYAEVFYRYTDPKDSLLQGSHGLGAALVMDLPTIFFLKGTFTWTSGSGDKNARAAANADYNLSTISVGGGAYMPITNKLHFVGEAGLVYANFQADGINKSYTDGGIYIRPSLRYQALDWLELQAGVTVASTDDYDSKIFDVLGYFRVFPMFDLNIGADFGDVSRGFRAGGRLRW